VIPTIAATTAMVAAIVARSAFRRQLCRPQTIGTGAIEEFEDFEDFYRRASPCRSAQALIAAASSSGRSSGEWWPARP
jgi:hypothetical protein